VLKHITAAALATCAVLAFGSMTSAKSQQAESASGRQPKVLATAGRYRSEITHTSVGFRILHMGLANYTARFTKMDATLDFDPARPERSRLTATVDMGSVETDYQNKDKDWNGELRNDPKFFNSGMFPQAKFVSTSVRRTGRNTAAVEGNLTFLGVTRPLTLDATYNGFLAAHPFAKVPALGFSARGKMKRSAWGLSYGLGKDLVDDVELVIEAEFLREGDSR
jgi:polyisoprenoid-binding protein YceI